MVTSLPWWRQTTQWRHLFNPFSIFKQHQSSIPFIVFDYPQNSRERHGDVISLLTSNSSTIRSLFQSWYFQWVKICSLFFLMTILPLWRHPYRFDWGGDNPSLYPPSSGRAIDKSRLKPCKSILHFILWA